MSVLKEEVVSAPGAAIHMTRTDVPEYLKRAIAASVERGKNDARTAQQTRTQSPSDQSSSDTDQE